MGATTVRDIVDLYRGAGCAIIDWRPGGGPIPHGQAGQALLHLDETIADMTDGNGLSTDRKPSCIADFGSGHSTHYTLAEASSHGADGEWVSRLLVSGPPLQYSL